MSKANDRRFLEMALEQAQTSYQEGGIPIGAAMVENGRVIGLGRNRRVQEGDPIAHGEMDCLRRAGRRSSYRGVTLYTTLSPCLMCAGTILQFRIPRVVIGENSSFEGNIEFLQAHEVQVVLVNDPQCKALMQKFIRENPDLWREDIGEA
jgi:cytosine/creatinine deaminase